MRATKVDYCDGSSSMIKNDEWISAGSSTDVLERRWTGTTIFPLSMDSGIKPSLDQLPHAHGTDQSSSATSGSAKSTR